MTEIKIYRWFPLKDFYRHGKKLKTNFQYRPLQEYKILDIKVHDKQFFYLTKNEVMSMAYRGNFKIKHGLQEPISFSIGEGNTVFVISKNRFGFSEKETQKLENFQWVGTPFPFYIILLKITS